MARPKAIRSIKDQKAFIHMTLVADAGWGKTVFGGSDEDVLFLTCDPEGTISAAAMGSSAEEWPIKTYKDLDEAYRWLRDEGHKEFKWACVDTVGGAQRILQRSALDASYAANPGKRDPDVPSMDVHQKAQIQTIKFIMQFNDLPMNTLYTAHPYNLEDAEGEPYILPYVHGGRGEVAQQALGHMNVAGFGVMAEDDNGREVRRVYFRNTGPYRGKDRFGKLPRYMDKPTLKQVRETIEAPASRPVRKTAAKKTAVRRATA
ncbi:RecA-like DNA recombinase [Streptomyces phage ShakeNBake]|nr:RecA-like DNA recombinase [Streptomyces phage PHTowN]QNO12881.1 RecA-like DNA recombinase [Streptomyces phage ShakeNBake]